MSRLTIGIVGVSGMVSETLLELLADADELFGPDTAVRVFASKAFAGKKVLCGNRALNVEEADLEALAACSVVIHTADRDHARRRLPETSSRGTLCIDLSGAFADDPDVPLLLANLNESCAAPLVACPVTCASMLATALAPLHKAYGLQRCVVSTYQSVSGSGKLGLEVLNEETRSFFAAQGPVGNPSSAYPKAIAFNAIPVMGEFLPNGSTQEEAALIAETRRLLDMSDLAVAATAVRIPVFVGDACTVTADFASTVSAEEVRRRLALVPGVRVVDHTPHASEEPEDDDAQLVDFITPREAHGQDHLFVSRIRSDAPNSISFWLCADNLRRNLAWNAIGIAAFHLKKRSQGRPV